MDGKKRNIVSKYTAKEELPIRGFLACSKCGRNLTGSASKGKMGGRYFYYYCNSTCGTRVKAGEINTSFKEGLSKLFFEDGYITLFEHVMTDYYKKNCRDTNKASAGLKQEIEKNQTRIANAQQLMVDGQLPAAEYMAIKNRYEAEIKSQQRELTSLSQVDNNLMEYVTESADLLRNVSRYYEKVDLPLKQKIVSSICIGKLEVDGNECRTPNFNEVIEQISILGADSRRLKVGQAGDFASLSNSVIPLGFERIY